LDPLLKTAATTYLKQVAVAFFISDGQIIRQIDSGPQSSFTVNPIAVKHSFHHPLQFCH